jgi:hypothetical protein
VAIGLGDVQASIAIGDKIYELTIYLSRTPSQDDGIYLMEMDFDAETREMGNGVAHYFPNALVPLTWQTFVATICEKFRLDPAVVLDAGVDVLAYWHDLPDGAYYQVPREADMPRYSLGTLYPPTR